MPREARLEVPTSETPLLETERYICRPLQAGDEEALWPAFSNEELMRYWSCAPFTQLSVFKDWLFDESWGGRTWVAVPKQGKPSLGNLPVFRMVASSPNDQVAEIGYMVVPGHARQGIARECLSALISHLFSNEGFHRIFADVDPRNRASNRLLEQLGFTREAHLREAMKTHIGWCDTWLWGLLAQEWHN